MAADGTGAQVRLLEGLVAEVLRAAGALWRVERLATDVAHVHRFVRDAFGWRDVGDGGVRARGSAVPVVVRPPAPGEEGVEWVPVFAVDDLDAAVAAATVAGGQVVRVAAGAAVLRDPTGALAGVTALAVGPEPEHA